MMAKLRIVRLSLVKLRIFNYGFSFLEGWLLCNYTPAGSDDVPTTGFLEGYYDDS